MGGSMSIVLQSAGGGSVTFQEPSTSTNWIHTLPAQEGILALTSQLGVTEADQWRLTTNFTNTTSVATIDTGWERSDTYGAGYVGTGMTQSSGVFTFPSTGTWLIQISGRVAVDGSQRFNVMNIEVTTNNSSYDIGSGNSQFISRVNSNFTVGSVYAFYVFNVTSTTNCKVRFSQQCEGTAGNWGGSTVENNTSVNFIRLGAST
jgi:hypothetical protein